MRPTRVFVKCDATQSTHLVAVWDIRPENPPDPRVIGHLVHRSGDERTAVPSARWAPWFRRSCRSDRPRLAAPPTSRSRGHTHGTSW